MSSTGVFSSGAANRYALALFELANEGNELEKIESEVRQIYNLINSNSEFHNMIISPIVEKSEQTNVLKKISEKFSFSIIFKKFLEFIASKRRLFFLKSILKNFLKLILINRGELVAKLISSKKLNNLEVENIRKELSSSFGSNLNISYRYEPSLLGGFVIQVGSTMIDTSIKNKLKQYKQLMMKK